MLPLSNAAAQHRKTRKLLHPRLPSTAVIVQRLAAKIMTKNLV